MDTNEISVEQIPAWKREGLPGIPVIWEFHYRDNPRRVSMDDLLRDAEGKVITAPKHKNVEELLSKNLGKRVEEVMLLLPGVTRNIDWNSFADVAVFRCDSKLSFRERHAAATLAWLSNNYYPPMERRERIVFPTFLDGLPDELRSPRNNVLLWKSFAEEKAHQVADALEVLFVNIETSVFEDGDGWFISIDKGKAECEFMNQLQNMETILWVLSYFDVTPIEPGMKSLYESYDEVPEVQKYIDSRADRVKSLNASQQRIEDGINAILAHLGHPTAGGDAHTLSEPKSSPASKGKVVGKKSSGKEKKAKATI
jgi:hypothetical protein